MSIFIQDLKHGLRVLAKSPGFAAAAIIVLALGIGANTAIFSIVNAVLLRPLPYPNAGRLMQVWHTPPQASFPGVKAFSISPANYLDWRAENHTFEHMAAYQEASFNLTGIGQPESVRGASVSYEFFPVLGEQPVVGRVFLREDDQPGHARVVVLSNAFWKNHLDGNPNVIGQTITLDDQKYLVIGVMPAKFRFPELAQLWVPLAWNGEERAVRGIHDYSVIARLKPGTDAEQAQAEMNTISSRLQKQYPVDDAGWGTVVVPLREDLVGDVRPALLMLLGAVAFVLLIACANVANLTLAKTLARRKEIAIRTVLGASRERVLRQVLSESVLLSLVGAALGLFLAHFAVMLMVGFFGNNLPRVSSIALDGWVLGFTLVIAIATGIVAGIAPAWRLTKTNLNETLKQGLGKTDADSGGSGTRNVLVVCEVALAVVLLIGAGLMIRTLWLLRSVNPGFDPNQVLTMRLPRQVKYREPFRQHAFYNQILQLIRALPAVESAGAVDSLPLSGGGSTQPVQVEGQPVVPMARQPELRIRKITPGYMKTMRIPLERGRDIGDTDTETTRSVVLVSESVAKRFWPNENPIGKHVTLTFSPERVREVAGVVGDIKDSGLDVAQPAQIIYVPLTQWALGGIGVALTLRTSADPARLIPAVTNAIHEVDVEEPALDVATMNDVMDTSLSRQRFEMLLLGAFAGLALLLAAVGIYSVLSYAVRRRAREIGIRMAVGANTCDVLRMVVIEGMKPALMGVVIGLAGALALSRVIESLIYGVSSSDPVTFVAVSVLLTAVAFFACVIPAYRATRIEPLKALREE